jgi:hypothetical protein
MRGCFAVCLLAGLFITQTTCVETVDTKRPRQPNTNNSDQALDMARPVAKGKNAPTSGQSPRFLGMAITGPASGAAKNLVPRSNSTCRAFAIVRHKHVEMATRKQDNFPV